MSSEKARENRLRRTAYRYDLRLVKSRRRDPDALDYGGYMLVDPSYGGAVIGDQPWGLPTATLDDIEDYLASDE